MKSKSSDSSEIRHGKLGRGKLAATSAGIRWGRVLGLTTVILAFYLIGSWAFPVLPIDQSESEDFDSSEMAIEPGERKSLGAGDLTDNQVREVQSLLQLGERLQNAGKLNSAVDAFAEVPDSAGDYAVAARVAEASTCLFLARLVDAEMAIDRLERLDPAVPQLLTLRTALLTASGRRWESREQLRRSIAFPHSERFSSLIYLSNLHSMPAPQDDYLAKMTSVADAYCLLGSSRVAAALGRKEQALGLLLRSRELKPEVIETSIQIIQLLQETGKQELFRAWLQQMPEGSETHPQYWIVKAIDAHENGQYDAAIRCYWEALRLDPNHDRACYQLGQLLALRGDVKVAKDFLDRAGRLALLIEEATLLYEMVGGQDSLANCARTCLELGRFAEADAWCDVLDEKVPNSPIVLAIRSKLKERSDGRLPFLADGSDLSARYSYASLPLPTADGVEIATTQKSSMQSSGQSNSEPVAVQLDPKFAFSDQAELLGIDFVYQNGDDPAQEGRRMFEYTGGGVGVVDFDLDTFPDIYFTQGSQWPLDASQREFLDGLYRNRQGDRFENVASQAGIVDWRFGQGVSVGDINSDGFPDLYVANLNGNRLLRNNGDGTFDDISDDVGIGHEHWTTSCLIADINGDSHPDLYDVTFLQGDNVFTAVCRGSDGVARSCAPKGFEAAPDQVYLNDGAGGFEPVSKNSGFDVPNGDGLGVVAANLEGDDQLEIFIASDGRPNFYFRPVESNDDGVVTNWQEEAIFSGLAFDDVGGAQACMGIAADDFDQNGTVDLYVTNFFQESNTLYVNRGQGAFLDQTRSFGLREASWQELGFGTQPIDADLDGWADLVVVNGHVDDFTHADIPYRMRPQLYRNLAGERFDHVPQASVGPYFEKPQLGRGLATLDWNRDGLVDFAVSNLEDRVSLVQNETTTDHSWISVRLVGLNRSRDAIGTRVSLQVGDSTIQRQLTAGDGYQASNERVLHFGLGDTSEPVSVTVEWPGGLKEVFDGIKPNSEYIAIEGRGVLAPTH